MLVTRGKLTVAQAARPAIVADCIECGGQAIFVAETADGSVDHRCGTRGIGPVWTLIERPRPTARERADTFAAELEAGGVLTAEQAAASLLPGPRGVERITPAAVA